MPRQIVWLIPILVLALGCKGGGSGPTQPVETYRLVYQQPCLTVPPVDPGPVLGAIPECEASVDGVRCPPLTAEQDAAIWVYIEALEDYSTRAWQCSERQRARREVGAASRPDGQGKDAGAARP
jgi:hypothetical protein